MSSVHSFRQTRPAKVNVREHHYDSQHVMVDIDIHPGCSLSIQFESAGDAVHLAQEIERQARALAVKEKVLT